MVKPFYPVLKKFKLGKKAILANEFVGGGIVTPLYSVIARSERSEQRGNLKANYLDCFALFNFARNDKQDIHKRKIVYFKGCVNEYINPRAKNAGEDVLEKLDVNILPIKFDCCGVPFLSCGNIEQFVKQAEYNLAQIPDEFDYFLTDCASCQNAFFEYENYIEDEKLLEKIKKINEKSLNIVDFVLEKTTVFEFEKEISFTFHKPCHLENTDFLDKFLSKAKNVKYIEMKDYDKCCGFAGEFALKNIEISEKISKEKMQNANETKADYILTSCPACILGLTQGAIESGLKTDNIMNFIEFLSLGLQKN